MRSLPEIGVSGPSGPFCREDSVRTGLVVVGSVTIRSWFGLETFKAVQQVRTSAPRRHRCPLGADARAVSG
ncbi:hypothetical protein GCM10009814_31960 [Lapillicoccus jejuensis]